MAIVLRNIDQIFKSNGSEFTSGGVSPLSGITTDSIVQIVQGKTTHRWSGTNENWTSLKDWLKCEITTKVDNARVNISTTFTCRCDDPTTVAFRWTREKDGVWTELEIGTDFDPNWDYSFATGNVNAPYWPFTAAHEYIDQPNVPAGTKLIYFLKYRDYGGSRLVHLNGTSNTGGANTDRGGGVATIIAKEIAESSAVAAEITAPENGQSLVYEDGKWINSLGGGGGIELGIQATTSGGDTDYQFGVTPVSGITSMDTSSLPAGSTLMWDGAEWQTSGLIIENI